MRTKDRITATVFINGVKVLRREILKGTEVIKTELIIVPPLGMAGREYDRWRVHNTETLERFAQGQEIEPPAVEQPADIETEMAVAELCEALEITRPVFKKMSADMLIVAAMRAGMLDKENTYYAQVYERNVMRYLNAIN